MRIVHCDGLVTARIVLRLDRVVVVDKPAGPSSEELAARIGGKLVHRIDAATSGLLLLADDARTAQRLQRALREGGVTRSYLLVAHGVVADARLETALVRDRGDGLRGTGPGGKRAVLDVRALRRGAAATLCEATLATGRTHQIRIQLAEAAHPLVGERVYVRDRRAAGLPLIPSPRLLLHARRLAFTDPSTKELREVVAEPPDDFARAAEAALVWSPPGLGR